LGFCFFPAHSTRRGCRRVRAGVAEGCVRHGTGRRKRITDMLATQVVRAGVGFANWGVVQEFTNLCCDGTSRASTHHTTRECRPANVTSARPAPAHGMASVSNPRTAHSLARHRTQARHTTTPMPSCRQQMEWRARRARPAPAHGMASVSNPRTAHSLARQRTQARHITTPMPSLYRTSSTTALSSAPRR